MTGIYYVEAADWLRAVGLTVVEVKGWQTRARSSGGFASAPLGIQWHHTASQTTPQNDTNWQFFGSSDAPIGNMTIMRDGAVWIGAAGAANTAGKGGPLTLSRGTVPLDSANSRTWAFEVANSGVGEPWPQVQIDAYFTASNELNRRFGNLPSDVFTHAINAAEASGWTSRKIDPATAAAVQGPWKPRSVSSSGTWSLADIRAECTRRAASSPAPKPPDPTPEPGPEPEPDPQGDTDMLFICRVGGVLFVGDGARATEVPANGEATIESNMNVAPRWRHPARSGLPVLTSIGDVPTINATQRDILVGKVS